MSTFILNPNDTIVLNDSIIVKMTKAAETCQTCVNEEAATNWADVEIVKYVCLAVVLVALIAAIAVAICYCIQMRFENMLRQAELDNVEAQRKDDITARQKEKEERLRMDQEMHTEEKKYIDSVQAVKILKEIANLARNKDSNADADTATSLHNLYTKIKNELASK